MINGPHGIQWHNLVNMRFICTQIPRLKQEIILRKCTVPNIMLPFPVMPAISVTSVRFHSDGVTVCQNYRSSVLLSSYNLQINRQKNC